MNGLKDPQQFRKIIADYHLSPAAKDALGAITLVILVAPTSAGRNTIIKRLVKSGKYYFIVSDTTREPRINDGVLEENGVTYWFRSEAEVLNDLKDGKYLEAELIHNQQVSGISIRELLKAKQHNKIAITDVDIGGVHNIVKAKNDAIAILVLPPSFEEWQRRFFGRGKMNDIEINRRLQTALNIYSHAKTNKDLTFLINDDIDESAQKIKNIVDSGQSDSQEQARARILIDDLEKNTINFLKNFH